jgi:Leucine-rich repeat (LRR) protein
MTTHYLTLLCLLLAPLQPRAQTESAKVDTLDFAYGRFALTSKGDHFYFIDKKGDPVAKLGQWDQAEPFKDGFAKVRKLETGKLVDYLLDTLGEAYRAAYTLQDLNPETTALYLTGTQLDSFPAQVLAHNQLEVLILDGDYFLLETGFSTLPATIGQFTKLKHLQLQHCQIDSLPAEIKELQNLPTLNLGYNQLTALPAQLGELKNLTTLDLRSNQLTALPAEIGGLKNLTGLNLVRNQLTALPAEIGGLKNLTTLYLGGNQLTALPAELGELKNLTWLDLGHNQLTALPAQLGELKNLTELDLSHNELTALPAQLGGLKNLIGLDLGGNQLPASEIGKVALPQLEILILKNMGLTTLPEGVFQLKNLKRLDLGNDGSDSKNPNQFSDAEQAKIRQRLPGVEISF